jgi:hypothetical protein
VKETGRTRSKSCSNHKAVRVAGMR